MRLTVHIQDRLGREIKILAENQRQSVSSLTAEALALYMQTKRRRELGQKVLALAGRAGVGEGAAEELERWRGDPHDRT
jgi:predicted transcriptional regulator